MVQEQIPNPDRPQVNQPRAQRYFPPQEPFSVNNGGYQPPRGGRSGGGGGMNWFGVIGIVLVVVLLVGGVMYSWTNSQLQSLQSLPSQVTQAINKMEVAEQGIQGKVDTAVNAATSGYNSRISALETGASGFITQTNLITAVNNALGAIPAQVAAIQSVIGNNGSAFISLQNNLTTIQTTVNQIIDLNDLQHNSIAVSIVNYASTFTIVGNDTAGYAAVNVNFQIKNNKNRILNLTDLKLSVNPALNLGIVNPDWFHKTSVSLGCTTIGALSFAPPIFGTMSGGVYIMDIIGINAPIAANGTISMVLSYRIDYTGDGVHHVSDVISGWSIVPTMTQISYGMY